MKYCIIAFLLSGCTYFDLSEPIPQDVVDHTYGVAEMYWGDMFVPVPLPMDTHPLIAVFSDSLPSTETTITYGMFHAGQLSVIEVRDVGEERDYNTCMDIRYTLGHEALHYLVWVTATDMGSDAHDVEGVFIEYAIEHDLSITGYVEHSMYMDMRYYCIDKWGDPRLAPQG